MMAPFPVIIQWYHFCYYRNKRDYIYQRRKIARKGTVR